MGRRPGFKCVVECVTCGIQYSLTRKTYRRRIRKTKSGKIFCSKSCSRRYAVKSYLGPKEKAKLSIPCSACRNQFQLYPSVYNARISKSKTGKLFCSQICQRSNHNFASRTYGTHSRTYAPRMGCVIQCSGCENQFQLGKGLYNARVKQSKSGKLYCSRSCRETYHHSHRGNAMKNRPEWSDERNYWEQLLCKEGLGMDRGQSKLDYGATDDPRDKWLREREKRGY